MCTNEGTITAGHVIGNKLRANGHRTIRATCHASCMPVSQCAQRVCSQNGCPSAGLSVWPLTRGWCPCNGRVGEGHVGIASGRCRDEGDAVDGVRVTVASSRDGLGFTAGANNWGSMANCCWSFHGADDVRHCCFGCRPRPVCNRAGGTGATCWAKYGIGRVSTVKSSFRKLTSSFQSTRRS